MRRREMLIASGVALFGLAASPSARLFAAEEKKKRKILFFTKSAGYVHSVVKRDGDKLSFGEKTMTDLCATVGIDVVCSQDSKVFDGDLNEFDAFMHYTTGDLKTNAQPMSESQKNKMLEAIEKGKPFFGLHTGTHPFRTEKGTDPYIAMVGAEFDGHDSQQKAKQKVVSPNFPGAEKLGESFEMFEEWYTYRKFAKDLRVILLQETSGMKGPHYQRPDFPSTWARMHGKGRVFVTSLGHREDVWTGKIFSQVTLGGLAWCLGDVDADVKPNVMQVCPKIFEAPEKKSA